jgi:hypothetical protein
LIEEEWLKGKECFMYNLEPCFSAVEPVFGTSGSLKGFDNTKIGLWVVSALTLCSIAPGLIRIADSNDLKIGAN